MEPEAKLSFIPFCSTGSVSCLADFSHAAGAGIHPLGGNVCCDLENLMKSAFTFQMQSLTFLGAVAHISDVILGTFIFFFPLC